MARLDFKAVSRDTRYAQAFGKAQQGDPSALAMVLVKRMDQDGHGGVCLCAADVPDFVDLVRQVCKQLQLQIVPSDIEKVLQGYRVMGGGLMLNLAQTEGLERDLATKILKPLA